MSSITTAPRSYEVRSWPVSFSAGGDRREAFRLVGEIFRPIVEEESERGTQFPAILLCGDCLQRQDSLSPLARNLAKRGYVVFAFNYRRTQKLQAGRTISEYHQDAYAAVVFLLTECTAVDQQLTILGFGLGSYLATLLSSQVTVHHMLLSGLVPYSQRSYHRPIGQAVRSSRSFAESFIGQTLGSYRGDLVLIYGDREDDELVDQAQQLICASNRQRPDLAGEEHGLLHEEWFEEELRRWLSRVSAV